MIMNRRGFSVFEVSASAVLLAALVSGSLEMIRRVLLIQEETRKNDIAHCEVANLMETVALTPWEELTEDNLSRLELSDAVLSELHNARLEVHVEATKADTDGKRILLRLLWNDPNNNDLSKAELACWRFQP